MSLLVGLFVQYCSFIWDNTITSVIHLMNSISCAWANSKFWHCTDCVIQGANRPIKLFALSHIIWATDASSVSSSSCCLISYNIVQNILNFESTWNPSRTKLINIKKMFRIFIVSAIFIFNGLHGLLILIIIILLHQYFVDLSLRSLLLHHFIPISWNRKSNISLLTIINLLHSWLTDRFDFRVCSFVYMFENNVIYRFDWNWRCLSWLLFDNERFLPTSRRSNSINTILYQRNIRIPTIILIGKICITFNNLKHGSRLSLFVSNLDLLTLLLFTGNC